MVDLGTIASILLIPATADSPIAFGTPFFTNLNRSVSFGDFGRLRSKKFLAFSVELSPRFGSICLPYKFCVLSTLIPRQQGLTKNPLLGPLSTTFGVVKNSPVSVVSAVEFIVTLS